MPHVAQEAHRGRRVRVVLGEPQLSGEDAPLERRPLGALHQRLPPEEIIFGHGPRRDALGRVVGQGAVLLEEAAVGGRLGHFCVRFVGCPGRCSDRDGVGVGVGVAWVRVQGRLRRACGCWEGGVEGLGSEDGTWKVEAGSGGGCTRLHDVGPGNGGADPVSCGMARRCALRSDSRDSAVVWRGSSQRGHLQTDKAPGTGRRAILRSNLHQLRQ